ncbi:MAG: glycosyltransferase, partial [bacterium]
MGTKEMYVSVIIPVYNDGERLKKCLTALAQQTYPQKNFEIIVVDNDSDDDIKAICKSFRVKYLKEVKKGSASSRNKGLNFAKGDIIASTDSDCIPDKNWLRNAVDFFKRNKDIDLI